MDGSRISSWHSSLPSCKKIKNVLASRFIDQQKKADSNFDTSNGELDLSISEGVTTLKWNSTEVPSTSGIVLNQDLTVIDKNHFIASNVFNTPNQSTSNQSSISDSDVLTSQPTILSDHNHIDRDTVVVPQAVNNHMNNQLIHSNIHLRSRNTKTNRLNSNATQTLITGEDRTSKGHRVYRLLATHNRTNKLLKEIKKVHHSIKKIFETQNELFKDQQQLEKIQNEVKEEFETIKNSHETYKSQNLLEENNVNLPMESMENFIRYCSLLEKSSEFRQILETSIQFTIGRRKSLTKNIAMVLRKYLSPELGSQFTAVKVAKTKTVLAKTSFHKHMLSIFMEKSAAGMLGQLTERDFNKALGEVLWNAKDWHKKSTP